MRFIKKISPEFLYGLTALTFLGFSVFPNESTDIVVDNTYYVTANSYLMIIISLAFFIFFGVTWILKYIERPMDQKLFLLHYLITIIGIISMILVFSIVSNKIQKYKDYSVYDEFDTKINVVDWNQWILIFAIFIVVGQFVFVVNVIKSIIRKS